MGIVLRLFCSSCGIEDKVMFTLSPRRKHILDFVTNFTLERGYAPSVKDLALSVTPSLNTIGVYAITDGNKKALYIGKCTGITSTLTKRFNYGYGSIQPRNCYERGQSTNCRINKLVLEAVKNGERLSLFFHKYKNSHNATDLEAKIISRIGKPPWNIQEPFLL